MSLRQQNLERLGADVFDVLIVGGGINGAVSAAALSARGLSVALIDRGDFACSTSQESSNLIWGGIKYLETFELGLVDKLCRSRNRLLASYPSAVREIRFFASIERGFRRPRWLLYLGTLLYWLIGRCRTRPPRLLSRADIEREEPAVRLDTVVGGVEYSDAYLIENDARFVFNFVRGALDRGAVAVNYVEALSAERGVEALSAERADEVPQAARDGHAHIASERPLWRCLARDRLSGREQTIRARIYINACGPYVDPHNQRMGITTAHRHVLSRGVHLLVDRVTHERRVLTFFADDGRLFFAIPMGQKSCIGTTDTRQEQLPAVVTEADRDFILDNINRRLALPRPLTRADVIAERCGVRPLVVDATDSGVGREWTQLSRKHAIEVDRARAHISILGGKLTDCLNVGEEVCAAVRALGLEHAAVAPWFGESARPESRALLLDKARALGLLAGCEAGRESLPERLWRRYGESAFALLEDIARDPRLAEVLIEGSDFIRGELYLVARREMVARLDDFLRRRSKLALVERRATLERSVGLREATRILFGERAADAWREYFGPRACL